MKREQVTKGSKDVGTAASPPAPAQVTNPLIQLQRAAGNGAVNALLRRASGGADPLGGTAVPGDLEARIGASSGQPLDAGTRSSMEGAFGADFSGVRVHTGAEAGTLSESLQAKAFTTGQDVFFGKGTYDPGSSSGQELLAHELTHVVQQSGGVDRTINRFVDPKTFKDRTKQGRAGKSSAQKSIEKLLVKYATLSGPPIPQEQVAQARTLLQQMRASAQRWLDEHAGDKRRVQRGAGMAWFVMATDAELESIKEQPPTPAPDDPTAAYNNVEDEKAESEAEDPTAAYNNEPDATTAYDPIDAYNNVEDEKAESEAEDPTAAYNNDVDGYPVTEMADDDPYEVVEQLVPESEAASYLDTPSQEDEKDEQESVETLGYADVTPDVEAAEQQATGITAYSETGEAEVEEATTPTGYDDVTEDVKAAETNGPTAYSETGEAEVEEATTPTGYDDITEHVDAAETNGPTAYSETGEAEVEETTTPTGYDDVTEDVKAADLPADAVAAYSDISEDVKATDDDAPRGATGAGSKHAKAGKAAKYAKTQPIQDFYKDEFTKGSVLLAMFYEKYAPTKTREECKALAMKDFGWSDEDFEKYWDKAASIDDTAVADEDKLSVAKVDPKDRANYELHFDATVTQGPEKETFSTKGMFSKGEGKDWAIFVMAPSGEVYAAAHKVGLFHHSSFLQGMPTAAAGEVWTDDAGNLKGLSNKSGHYVPEAEHMLQMFEEVGVGKLGGVKYVHRYGQQGLKKKQYDAADFYRQFKDDPSAAPGPNTVTAP